MDTTNGQTFGAEPGSETAADIGANLREKVETGKQKVAEKFETGKGAVADTMGRAADQLSRGSSGLSDTMGRTADKMAAGADYLRSNSGGQIWGDCEAFLRRHPLESIAAAVVVGVLVGRSMRSN